MVGVPWPPTLLALFGNLGHFLALVGPFLLSKALFKNIFLSSGQMCPFLPGQMCHFSSKCVKNHRANVSFSEQMCHFWPGQMCSGLLIHNRNMAWAWAQQRYSLPSPKQFTGENNAWSCKFSEGSGLRGATLTFYHSQCFISIWVILIVPGGKSTVKYILWYILQWICANNL